MPTVRTPSTTQMVAQAKRVQALEARMQALEEMHPTMSRIPRGCRAHPEAVDRVTEQISEACQLLGVELRQPSRVVRSDELRDGRPGPF